MNPPRMYTCSPSWTPLPCPSPYHPSGSSQCPSPKYPLSFIKPGLAISSYMIWHVSMPFSQVIPPSSSPTESKRLFSFAVSHTGLSLPSFWIPYICVSILYWWRRQWHPTPVLLPGKSHGWRSLVGCSPWGLWQLDMTDWLHFHFSLSWLEKEMATHSGVLAWRIPGMEEPVGLLSVGSHRVGHDWHDLAACRLVITFLPRSKHLLISWLQSPSAVILEPPKIKSATVSTVSPSICHEVMGPDAMI